MVDKKDHDLPLEIKNKNNEPEKEQDLAKDEIEFKLLLEGIFLAYGHDFRNYSLASLQRRFRQILNKWEIPNFSYLLHKILHEPEFFSKILLEITVNVTEMFRDPSFYLALRKNVIPILRTYPTLKIWHAGCSTGEEVYSLAILLHEENLYQRSIIYATDINREALKKAKEGIYSTDRIQDFTQNYQLAGGGGPFSQYYTARYGSVRMNSSLISNVVFAEHNLVIDQVFSETHLIFCRNVLIYFNRDLQNRVVNLFLKSLCYKGFLCLGSKETVKFLESRDSFQEYDREGKIFQKVSRTGAEIFVH